MHRHILSALALCSIMLCQIAAPAFAQENEAVVTTVPSDSGQNYSEVFHIGEDGNTYASVYPVSINMQTIGGVPYITKIYEVPADYPVEQLASEFKQDGCTFSRSDILVKHLDGVADTKFMSKTVTAAAQSDEKSKLLAAVEQTLVYNQDGYSGELSLDAESITFAEADRTSYGYTMRETREYDGLDRNDAAYIDKTMQKNGATLELESVDWQVMGTTPVDGALIPNLYKAVATYSGRATGSKVSGYTATMIYHGEVTKVSPGQQQVSVIYRGVPILETEPKSGIFNSASLLGVCILSFLFACCGAALVVFLANLFKKRAGREFDYPEDDETAAGEQELLDAGYTPLADEEGLEDDEIY